MQITETLHTNKEIVAEFVEELTNRHNPDAWQMYCAEDFRHHFNLPNIPSGCDGVEQLSRAILTAFPDVHVTMDLLLQEGDTVVERATATGTHAGEFIGIAPTGQRLQWTEAHTYRLRDGKIVEHFPEIRLEMLLAQVAGRKDYFQAPRRSGLSRIIALAMSAASGFYRPPLDRHIPYECQRQERNRTVVARYIEDFKNQQKFLVFPQLFAADFRHHFNFPALPHTMETFISVGQNFLAAFPDVRVEVQDILVDGAYVVERNQVRATHKGTFAGIKATGRAVNWTETHIYRLKDGKIVENWPLVNFERILAQIR
ncbi:MAG: ester cyclase [Chloroflexota bacterium]